MQQLQALLAVTRARSFQEKLDLAEMQAAANRNPLLLYRENLAAHMTASAWIVNTRRDRILLIYHKIYDSWSWTGGHADGDPNLPAVALREAMEESGLSADALRLLSEQPLSLEILPVERHWRRGHIVTRHWHYNLTYLLEADEEAPLHTSTVETSGVRWFPLADVSNVSRETKMRLIYDKLNERLLALFI